MPVPKIVLLSIWAYCLACFVLPLPLSTMGRYVAGIMLLIHVLEFAVNLKLFRRADGSLGHHFVQTLTFGILHIKSVGDAETAVSDS